MTNDRAELRNKIATEIASDLGLEGLYPEDLADDIAIIARRLHEFELQIRRDERADVEALLGRAEWLAWSVAEGVLVEAAEVAVGRGY